ncbi:uncharacterized protein LOC135835081 isoform X2 [Planococcus citri]|uniref:uncharacterized protein LOC135835081 isoform X2 n=1 Tax=Planococcus citri TaxID=170843 RepID=UPI0031F82DD3
MTKMLDSIRDHNQRYDSIKFVLSNDYLKMTHKVITKEEKFKVDGNAHSAAMKTEELFGVESMDCSTMTSSDVKCCGGSDDLDDSKDLSSSISSMVDDNDRTNGTSNNSSCSNNNNDDCCSISNSGDHRDDLCGTGSTTTATTTTKTCSSSSSSSLDDDMQDLYGSRNYGLPSSRPTMISAKYRQKEERRKVLKLSMHKLKRIEDPESSLRRSVLINNTVKRLQREAKEEKSQKSQITSSLASQNKCFGLTSDFLVKQEENLKNDYVVGGSLSSRTSDQLLDITNLPDGKTCSKYGNDCLDCDEAISDLTFPGDRSLSKGRKRSIDEIEEECDVLSQFYLPPPTPHVPHMISKLDEDEDEDVNVVDIDTPVESLTKKRRGCGDSSDTLSCCLTAADRLRDNLPSSHFDEWSMDESILLQATAQTSQPAPSSSPFSCGHSSMLNEIVVYHNLIASLES